VSGDHRLHQFERLAYDDPVRPHPQRVDEQVMRRRFSLAVFVGQLRFEIDRMGLGQLQLRAVLDHEDPLGGRDRRL
jgi:hypothetical protein